MVDQFSAWSDAMGASAEGYSSPGERGGELIAAGKRATAELNDYIRAADSRPSPAPDDAVGSDRDDGSRPSTRATT